MIYPKFLRKESKIGVTAPSDGIIEDIHIKRYENAKKKFMEEGFKVIETSNVITSNLGRSSSILDRKKELESLYIDKSVDLILCAAGGDFLAEILPYLDYNLIKENPKWIQGYSDISLLLYTITTNLDIATICAYNVKTFGMRTWHKSLIDNIELWKGKKLHFESLEKYEKERKSTLKFDECFKLDGTTNWKSFDDKVNITGRIIGGCIDSINTIIGTKYDGASKFIEKYKEDGIIWYFDNFAYTSEKIILSMFKLEELGYFKYTKLVIFGRSLVDESDYGISFKDAIYSSLNKLNIKVIYDIDLGHVYPQIPIINGAIAKVSYEKGKGSIEFELR